MKILLAPFAWLLLFFYNIVGNYGIALIIFALVVKLVLFPVSLKGKRGMIQMNMLSGKMQKLQKQYGADKERYNQEVQNLYEREKVNPMGGCLWTMLPLLVLLPLYAVIRQPLQYLMNLTPDQISAVAEALNWAQVSLDMGWVKEVAEGVANTYTTGAYNELFLASLFTEGNLQTVQAAVGEGTKVFVMNFSFLGMDLSQVPNWKFWANGMDWTSIGLFVMVVISAGTGLLFSRVSMKTNTLNQQPQTGQAAQTSKMMMFMSPLMSLWIGFIMPGLLCLYWISNNVLSMGQEFVASKMLKKDYEKAAALQAENEAREKEEEKRRKKENAERRALEAEEAKKNKKAAPKKKDEDKPDHSVLEVSRVGLRSYARGRAYDPARYDATEYRDPNTPVVIDPTPATTTKGKKKQQAAIAAALEENLKAEDQVEQTTQETAETLQETPSVEESVVTEEAAPQTEEADPDTLKEN